MLRISFLLIFISLLISCSKESNNPVNSGQTNQNTTGALTFAVSIKEMKVQYNLSIDSVIVTLQGPTTVKGKLTILDSTASGTFLNLNQGNYTILVAMFSGSDTIAEGTGSAIVLPGEQTTAIITLSFLPGQLTINVTLPPSSGKIVAYYPFNGNADDESGNGNNGVVYGATLTADRFGNSNSAYNFNGTSDFISIPALFNTPPAEFSISVFVQPTSFSGNYSQNMIYFSGDGGEVELFIGQTSVEFLVLLTNGTWYEVSSPITLSVWHHIAVTFQQGNEIELFLDGALVNTTTVPNLALQNPGSGFQSSIGSYARTKFFFQGNLDDIRIFNYVLSSNEVQNYYHEGGWAE